MRRWLLGLLLVGVLWVGGTHPQPARAQEPDAWAIINEVNALRANRGLAPYTVNPWLMEYAQQHSDYQASIGTSTHTHSDGSLPWEEGIQENVASGSTGFITVDFIVYQIWADPVHMKPMVGYAGGTVGVGVAITDGMVYYTFDMLPSGVEISQTAAKDELTTLASATPFTAEEALVTLTPLADGSVYHVIGYGQTLWDIAIAYGVTVQKIRDFNNIPENSTDIYAGQKLLIKLPGTPYTTSTPTATETPLASQTPVPTLTFTPSPTRTPTRTPMVTSTAEQAAPTEQALPVDAAPEASGWGGILGSVLLALAGFGLGVWVGLTWAERKRRSS